MRYSIVIIFLIALNNSTGANAQTSKERNCSCSLIVDVNFKGRINLYDHPGGKVINTLAHNFKDEDYVVLEIEDKNDSMYKVKASYSIQGDIAEGWIKRKSLHAGIYSRAYSRPLNLYQRPDSKSPIRMTINQFTPKLFHVTECVQHWLHVEILLNGKAYEGWMAPSDQCDNPYTTCS